MSFISIGILDIVDILLVAFLLYQVYMLIKGTVAINIFVGLFVTYLIWLLVRALNMELISNILGQIMGVGVIALIIVFQQEIRRFLLLLGSRYFANTNFSLENLFSIFINERPESIDFMPIVKSCVSMASTKTGALIVISNKSELDAFSETGEILNSKISSRTIETIFFKNSPLHDGAMIITNNKIHAAACVLPVSEDTNLPKQLGMRHRAALGMSEVTDALILIVSEETGNISFTRYGKIKTNIGGEGLQQILEAYYNPEERKMKRKWWLIQIWNSKKKVETK